LEGLKGDGEVEIQPERSRVMGKAGTVTNVQRKLLNACAGTNTPVWDLVEELKIQRHRVEEWPEKKPFRKAVARRMAAMKMMMELDIVRGGEIGVRRLMRAAAGNGDFTKANLYERRACKDIAQLAVLLERCKAAEKRARRKARLREEERKKRIEDGGSRMEAGGKQSYRSEEEERRNCEALDRARAEGQGTGHRGPGESETR
jgi:hypothetical protein